MRLGRHPARHTTNTQNLLRTIPPIMEQLLASNANGTLLEPLTDDSIH